MPPVFEMVTSATSSSSGSNKIEASSVEPICGAPAAHAQLDVEDVSFLRGVDRIAGVEDSAFAQVIVRGDGIISVVLHPGWVKTDAAMLSLSKIAARDGRSERDCLDEIMSAQAFPGLMEPDDVASTYLFLASDAAANITGQTLNVDRGELMA